MTKLRGNTGGNMDLNELANLNNISCKKISDIVRPYYSGLDRPLITKVCNPQKYGIYQPDGGF